MTVLASKEKSHFQLVRPADPPSSCSGASLLRQTGTTVLFGTVARDYKRCFIESQDTIVFGFQTMNLAGTRCF